MLATLPSPTPTPPVPTGTAGTTTPAGYFRDEARLLQTIRSSTPSRPVGLLRCQVDPMLRQLDTTVVDARPALVSSGAAGPANKGSAKDPKAKGGKKGKQEVPEPAAADKNDEGHGDLYHVLLADTVVFPEGGGQPCDTGTLTIEGGSGQPMSIVRAERRGLDAVHVVRVPSSEAGQLVRGARVRLVVDWARRADHMDQHTGQHLLSAVLERLPAPIPTLSWALTASPNPCYVELTRAPSAQELADVQTAVDAAIAASTPVHVDVAPLDAVPRPESMPDDYAARSDTDSGAVNVNTQGVVRTVTLSGAVGDRNACCGTHWPSLAPIRIVHIHPSTSRVRGTNVRVYFSAGSRAISGLTAAFNTATDLARALDTTRPDAPARLTALSARERATRKREQRLREEVAVLQAQRIIRALLPPSLPPIDGTTGRTGDAEHFAQHLASLDGRTDIAIYRGPHGVAAHVYRADADAELIAAIAKEVADAYTCSGHDAATQQDTPKPLLLVLQSGPTAPLTALAQSGASAALIMQGVTPTLASAPASGPAEAEAETQAKPKQTKAPGGKTKGKSVGGTGGPGGAGEALVARAAELLRESPTLGQRVRGGGKGRWQGKLTPSAQEAEARWDPEDQAALVLMMKQVVGATE